MVPPLVSVVMPTYNRAHLLDKAIGSVISQSFSDWELVISDDASKDHTQAIVEEWQRRDDRIRPLRNKVNLGLTKNYNNVMKAARGTYIALIDDDDQWLHPDKLKLQIEFLKSHANYVGVGGGMVVVDQEGKELFRYLQPETDAAIRKTILFSNSMANATTMFRKSAGEKVGFYNEAIHRGADRDFWLKMGKVGKLHNLSEYLAYYTVAGQNSLFKNQRELFGSSLAIIKRYKNDYPNYLPALAFNAGMYAYSFLPESLRQLINMPLFYIKRKTFGRT